MGKHILQKDYDPEFLTIYTACVDFTMTSSESMYALYKAVKYVIKNNLEGDFVECGVWKGGSTMLIAMTLTLLGDSSRKIYLYDTYKGMAEPTKEDDPIVLGKWKRHQKDDLNDWCYASLDDVKNNMAKTGYPVGNLVFIQGKVEDTIPSQAPEKISLLRVDTDWYQSTLHELDHLYPRLAHKGVLIIDDYGHHEGARLAVNQYFEKHGFEPYLGRIDYTGRVVVKTEQ